MESIFTLNIAQYVEERFKESVMCKYCEDEANIFEWDERHKGARCWELMI